MTEQETSLRNELRQANMLRKEAEAKLSEARQRLERGQTLLEQVEAECVALEASQKEFHSKCEKDHAFAVLAAVDGGGLDDIVLADTRSDTAALIAARTKLSACRNAVTQLADDFASAQQQLNRAAQAVNVLADGIIYITVETAADAATKAQEAAWDKLDCLRAACTIDARRPDPRTHTLQQSVDRKLDRFKSAVDQTGQPMDHKDWADYQIAAAKAHEPSWQDFAKRLADDADATFSFGKDTHP